MAARYLATPIKFISRFATRLDIAKFLVAYGIYLAASTSEENEDDEFEELQEQYEEEDS